MFVHDPEHLAGLEVLEPGPTQMVVRAVFVVIQIRIIRQFVFERPFRKNPALHLGHQVSLPCFLRGYEAHPSV